MHTNGDCHVDRVEPLPRAAPVADARTVTLAVAGMGCPTCVNRVYNALARTRGVLDVDVSLENAIARVVFDRARVDGVDLVQVVASAGNDGRHNYRAVLIPDQPGW